jgi:phosphatidylserine/phosphatidylglycerophosphate/cardiolipin synthase-like enzyme
MLRFKRFYSKDDVGLVTSQLYNEQSFYPAFFTDVKRATSSIIIESPFISQRRLRNLYSVVERAIQRGVCVTINTRNPECHDDVMRQAAINGIAMLQGMGAVVLYTGNHHRKLAIIDRRILYEGSLNILSQSDSCEVMRRIESEVLAEEMLRFAKLEKYL